MSRFGTYYARFTGVRNDLTGLPPWARSALILIVSPGIVLVGLSILLLLVSIAALLFLAVPAYVLLRGLAGTPHEGESAVVYDPGSERVSAKKVEAKMLDQRHGMPDEVNGE